MCPVAVEVPFIQLTARYFSHVLVFVVLDQLAYCVVCVIECLACHTLQYSMMYDMSVYVE